jgi:hypothetical protein
MKLGTEAIVRTKALNNGYGEQILRLAQTSDGKPREIACGESWPAELDDFLDGTSHQPHMAVFRDKKGRPAVISREPVSRLDFGGREGTATLMLLGPEGADKWTKSQKALIENALTVSPPIREDNNIQYYRQNGFIVSDLDHFLYTGKDPSVEGLTQALETANAQWLQFAKNNVPTSHDGRISIDKALDGTLTLKDLIGHKIQRLQNGANVSETVTSNQNFFRAWVERIVFCKELLANDGQPLLRNAKPGELIGAAGKAPKGKMNASPNKFVTLFSKWA